MADSSGALGGFLEVYVQSYSNAEEHHVESDVQQTLD
jgi:hypothetical protein